MNYLSLKKLFLQAQLGRRDIMDGLENPKIFYKYWFKHLIYYSHTHNSPQTEGRRQSDVNIATTVSVSTISTENFLATGYYSPWGLPSLCQVVWVKMLLLNEIRLLLSCAKAHSQTQA